MKLPRAFLCLRVGKSAGELAFHGKEQIGLTRLKDLLNRSP